MNDLRAAFPMFSDDSDYVYLDNAATTQKPEQVLRAIRSYYEHHNANVHRGVHALSTLATEEFEQSRVEVAGFINAPNSNELIWTRGTTEALNLVAQSYAASVLKPGNRVIVSEMEHHSNIVPWQMVCERTGAQLDAIRVLPNGELDQEHYDALLNSAVKIVSLAHVSNALGTVNPVQSMTARAKAAGAAVAIDGAQAVPHMEVDVQSLGCDFYAFSAHKMYGPTGIGALYAREDLMGSAPPWQGGGEMIERVRLDGTTYQKMPFRFEAGTPNIAGAVGMREAVRYLCSQDRSMLERHESDLLHYATARLKQIEGVAIVGEASNKTAVLSFNVQGAHPSDIGTLLDQQGIAVRTGHHCAMPLMEKLGIAGTVRASFAIYNSRKDIDKFTVAVEKACDMVAA